MSDGFKCLSYGKAYRFCALGILEQQPSFSNVSKLSRFFLIHILGAANKTCSKVSVSYTSFGITHVSGFFMFLNNCKMSIWDVISVVKCTLFHEYFMFQVILAKEAGLCYASMGLVTDYDSWREETESVGHTCHFQRTRRSVLLTWGYVEITGQWKLCQSTHVY